MHVFTHSRLFIRGCGRTLRMLADGQVENKEDMHCIFSRHFPCASGRTLRPSSLLTNRSAVTSPHSCGACRLLAGRAGRRRAHAHGAAAGAPSPRRRGLNGRPNEPVAPVERAPSPHPLFSCGAVRSRGVRPAAPKPSDRRDPPLPGRQALQAQAAAMPARADRHAKADMRAGAGSRWGRSSGATENGPSVFSGPQSGGNELLLVGRNSVAIDGSGAPSPQPASLSYSAHGVADSDERTGADPRHVYGGILAVHGYCVASRLMSCCDSEGHST